MLRSLSIKCMDRFFGDASHLVNSAMAEVDDLLRMSQRPFRIHRRTRVARVCSGGGVSVAQRHAELAVINQAGEPAIANALQLAVPSRDRHPDFDLDVRVCSRFRLRYDAAKCGEPLVELGQVLSGEGHGRAYERASGDRLGERNRGAGDLCRRQFLAGRFGKAIALAINTVKARKNAERRCDSSMRLQSRLAPAGRQPSIAPRPLP